MQTILFLATILAASPDTSSRFQTLECTLDWEGGNNVITVRLSESTSNVTVITPLVDGSFYTTSNKAVFTTDTITWHEVVLPATNFRPAVIKKVQIDRLSDSYVSDILGFAINGMCE